MRLALALSAVLLAGQALAQISRYEDVPLYSEAHQHGSTEPEDLMFVGLANCLIWAPGIAYEALNRGGWTVEHDEIIRLSRGEVTLALAADQGWCDAFSPVLTQSEARAVAEKLLSAHGGTIQERTEQLGCTILSTDARPGTSIMIAGEGSDESSCIDNGRPGARLNLQQR